jgi:hypothetical protein
MYEAHNIQLRWKHAASCIRASFQSETVEATVKGPFLHAALTLYLKQKFVTDFCKMLHKLTISMRTARSDGFMPPCMPCNVKHVLPDVHSWKLKQLRVKWQYMLEVPILSFFIC